MIDKLRYLGWASTVSGWLVISLSIIVNPWFIFTENAFSDFGAESANYPWLFNTGMILTGAMIVLFGVYLFTVALNIIAQVGGGSMSLTGVTLMLIGFYYEGTPYHYLVSVWFFSQGAITILIWGLALVKEKQWSRYGWFFLFIEVVTPVLAVILPWPSTATVEAFGILVLNLWVAVITWLSPRFIGAER